MICTTFSYIAIVILLIVYTVIVAHLWRKLRRAERRLAKEGKYFQGKIIERDSRIHSLEKDLETANTKLAKFDHRSRKRGPDGRFEDTPEPE